MCGLVSLFDYSKSLDQSVIKKMTEAIFNRGPDDGDSLFIENNDYNLALGHRRLSIIDLSQAGRQPIKYKHLVMVYNGEIYNYQKIKNELLSLGHEFKTQTDSEVVLAAYLEWKEKCLDKFIGMFAFVIYDENKQECFIARDRFGVKPLYYVESDKYLAFSSEIKGLHPIEEFSDYDTGAISHYFQFGYTDSEQTVYSKIKKFLPGHYGIINLKTKSFQKYTYWSADSFINKRSNRDYDTNHVIDTVEQLIIDSCKNRLVADVPVGVFLSGGYDSSLVAAICKKQNQDLSTFTISFSEKEYNEGIHAQKVAKHLGTNHHNFLCTENEALELSKIINNVYDEPFADSSAIPTLLLSKLTKEHVKVSLSADGGDEFFAGYTRYEQLAKFKKNKFLLSPFASIVPTGITSTLLKNFIYNPEQRIKKIKDILSAKSPEEALDILTRYFPLDEAQKLLNAHGIQQLNPNESGDYINDILLRDTTKYLPNDILVKVDRATMHYGLEGREPLLDHKLFEYVASLPGSIKYNSDNLKYLLKKISYKYIPKELLDRPKKGFSVPIKKWMNSIYKEEFLDLLSDDLVRKQGILNIDVTQGYKRALINNENINYQKLWIIFQFQKWIST
jgi:asparagine synthase (glutamine-hydrolysing)